MARCASRVAAVSYWTSNRKHARLAQTDAEGPAFNPDSKVVNGDVGSGDAMEIRSSLSLDKDSRRFLNSFINRIEGLYAIIITDRDGVPVVKVMTEQMPSSVMKSSFLATVSLAIDQAGKVGLGKNKRIICMFKNYQVVHFNKCPLMVSLIASSSSNTGLLLNLDSELSPLTDELKVAVDGI